jgi:hypothetical protein
MHGVGSFIADAVAGSEYFVVLTEWHWRRAYETRDDWKFGYAEL